MCILIIDDDKLICDNIKSKLSRLGYLEHYEILIACNATDAEFLFDSHRPSIVITDIHMPFVDGLTLIERLNKKEHKASIFVLSGYDDYNYVRRAFLLGATDYMLKPVDIDELAEKLSKITELTPSKLTGEKPQLLDSETDIMRLALQYIDANVSRRITMKMVADNVCLSYNYFSKLFKEYTNSHFSNYVHNRRIELSKKYLREPGFKIQDIAKKLGYENPSEFSRAFKNCTGCYPTEYRENNTENQN